MRQPSTICRLLRLFTILMTASLSMGCSTANYIATVIITTPQSPNPLLIVTHYRNFTIPGPESASFELPEGWDFWGNGGWLSPDNGHTLAGLRMTWTKPGQDARRLLFNEDAVILEQSSLTINQTEMTRYKVITYLTNAATRQRVVDGYELIYAFPGNKPNVIAGVFVRAASLKELDPLEPIVEHMAASVKWITE
jgi:hypothetical protein